MFLKIKHYNSNKNLLLDFSNSKMKSQKGQELGSVYGQFVPAHEILLKLSIP